MYADLAMDNRILKDLLTKRLGPATKRELSEEVAHEEGIAVSRACKLMSLPAGTLNYGVGKANLDTIYTARQNGFIERFNGTYRRDGYLHPDSIKLKSLFVGLNTVYYNNSMFNFRNNNFYKKNQR